MNCGPDCLPVSQAEGALQEPTPLRDPWRHIDGGEKAGVIRLVEKLHSADNPTAIAHGFPAPEMENKHTLKEYQMKKACEYPQTEVQTHFADFPKLAVKRGTQIFKDCRKVAALIR